jgi:hypothetical protein
VHSSAKIEKPPEPRGPLHTRRVPEDTFLYGVVSDQLITFFANAENAGREVPAFVARELPRYLECGILAHGLVRVRCPACMHERLVAFSCRGRGFCPSCGGRRMADTAAFLVDRVIPHVPVRQWVLSLPIGLRYKLAYDSALAAAVLQLFVRSVFASLRRRARRTYGPQRYECGSIMFVQRFGDALNLNLHFHSIVLDGVYEHRHGESPRFRRLAPPTDAEVEQTTRRVVRRLRNLLIRRGLTPDADASTADPLPEEQPLLAELYAASVRSRIATGDRAGLGVLRIGQLVDPEETAFVTGRRCAMIDGVSLHANIAVPKGDRRRLEKLCRYIARSGFSAESVKLCTSTLHPDRPMALALAWNGSRGSLDSAHAIVRGYRDTGLQSRQLDPADVSTRRYRTTSRRRLLPKADTAHRTPLDSKLADAAAPTQDRSGWPRPARSASHRAFAPGRPHAGSSRFRRSCGLRGSDIVRPRRRQDPVGWAEVLRPQNRERWRVPDRASGGIRSRLAPTPAAHLGVEYSYTI